MRLINFIAITLILTLCIPFGAQAKSKTKKRGKVMINSNILEKRYSDFSSDISFILLKVRNANKEAYVVYDNKSWSRLCQRQLALVKDSKEYVSYMVKNHDKTFDVPSNVFNEMIIAEAKQPNFKEKTWQEIKAAYFEEERPRLYKLKDSNLRLGRNMSFLRLLLEQNLFVGQGSYDGAIFVTE